MVSTVSEPLFTVVSILSSSLIENKKQKAVKGKLFTEMLNTKNERKVKTLLLGLCNFTGNTAQLRNISSKLAYFELYFQ